MSNNNDDDNEDSSIISPLVHKEIVYTTDYFKRAKRNNNVRISQKRFDRFFEILGKTGNVRLAASLAPVDRSHMDKLKKRKPEIKERFDKAIATYQLSLQEAAYQRAVNGVKRPIFQQGEKVGEETVYSDGLLRDLLRSAIPEMREDKFVNHPELHKEQGIIVLPAFSVSPVDWKEQFGGHVIKDDKMLEGDIEDVRNEPNEGEPDIEIIDENGEPIIFEDGEVEE